MLIEYATVNYGFYRFIYRIISNIISRSCLISSHARGKIFRRLGVSIAENVFVGQHVYFDELAPNRIHIGRGSKITRGVTCLTHFIDPLTGSFVLGDVFNGKKNLIGGGNDFTLPQ